MLGLAWVAGLVAVGAWDAPWWMGGAWVAASAPALIAARRRYVLVGACAGAALASGWLLERDLEWHPPAWQSTIGEDVTLKGVVVSEPDRGLTVTGYVLSVDSLTASGINARGGRVLVQFHQYARYLPGDRLTLQGKLELPPTFDTFDYRAYLRRRDIAAVMFRPRVLSASDGDWSPARALTSLRLDLDRGLARSLPEPEASLAAGIAFGREDGLSPEAKEEYNRSGLRHLVAVSGSNVVLVAALTSTVAVPLVGRRWAWIPAGFVVATYLAAAGLAPSVVRAGIMAGVLLVGSAAGRPQSGLPALAAAVVAMTAISPRVATEAGFQLSAAATAGLIVLAPWLSAGLLAASRRLGWFTPPVWVCEAAALTLAATIATLPVMWATFGRVSLVSPLANVIVQPAFALAFWLSLLTAVTSLVSGSGGNVLGVAAYYPLAFIGWLAGWAGNQRLASISVAGGGASAALLAYAVLAVPAALAYRFRPRYLEKPATAARRQRSGRLVFAGAAGAAALAVVPVSFAPRHGPGELVVDFLDVGQGDAILLTTPGGRQVLIDGGPSGLQVARELGSSMPHWDRTIDVVILSHPQEDHAGGLPEVAERFEVGRYYDSGHRNGTLTFAAYERQAPERTVLAAGDTLDVDGVRFEVLWPRAGYSPGDLNDASLIIRVTYGEVVLLFTGDALEEALEGAAKTRLRADVLKVPHHGSRTTSLEFLEQAAPSIAVIQAGAGNPFGHPHAETLAALHEARIYRTDLHGRITVASDGESLWVSTER